jgi:hypothetical protein
MSSNVAPLSNGSTADVDEASNRLVAFIMHYIWSLVEERKKKCRAMSVTA